MKTVHSASVYPKWRLGRQARYFYAQMRAKEVLLRKHTGSRGATTYMTAGTACTGKGS